MNFLEGKEEIAVVVVRFIGDQKSYEYFHVVKQGEEIELDSKSTFITESFKELKKKVKTEHFILIFSGDNVLYTDNELLYKTSKDDFYATGFEVSKNISFLALIRKELVDNEVTVFQEQGLLLLDLYIGVFTFNLLFKGVESEIEFENITLKFEESQFFDLIQKGSESLKVSAKNQETLVLSSILNCFYPSDNIINTYDNELFNFNKGELKHKKDFNLFVKVGILSLFVVVAFFYLLGEYYATKNIELQAQENVGVNKQKEKVRLEKEENRKLEMLKLSGFYKKKALMFYVNEIVRDLPVSVILKDVEIFPFQKKISEEKKIEISDKTILIRGDFTDVNSFNKWAYDLRKVLDIETLSVDKYEKKGIATNFELSIMLK